MKALIDAVVSTIKGDSTLAAFAGTGGPFWNIAPEGTQPPYMTLMQIGGIPPLYGFSGLYIEGVQLQFDVRDVTAEAATANAELLCNVIDTLTSLYLAGGQLTREPIRKDAVRLVAEAVSGTGQRIYHAIVVYTFRVQRTKGT